MARYFSNHFAPRSSATIAPATSVANVRIKMESGINRVPVTAARASLDFSAVALADMQIGDQWRLATLKSSDRLWEIHGWWDNAGSAPWTGTIVNFETGLFTTGINHEGIVVDSNMFGTAATLLVAGQRQNLMTTANVVDEGMRGLQVWEIINDSGIQTITKDPQVEYDLVASLTAVTGLSAVGQIVIEAVFSPAGK